MNESQELAFLHSLMLGEGEPMEPLQSQCPEPGIFWSLTQEEHAASATAAELRNHMASCASCRDLAHRLQAFHDAGEPKDAAAERAWAEASPQLDRWLAQQMKDVGPAEQPGRVLRFPARRWGLGVALAACAAGVGVFAVLDSRHSSLPLPTDHDHVATTTQPAQPYRPRAAERETGAHRGPSDIATLSENRQIITSNPSLFSFSQGEHLTLILNAVTPQQDGTYRLHGTLSGSHDGNDTASVTGNWDHAEGQNHPTVTIRQASENLLSSATVVSSNAVPAVGQSLEIEMSQNGGFKKDQQ